MGALHFDLVKWCRAAYGEIPPDFELEVNRLYFLREATDDEAWKQQSVLGYHNSHALVDYEPSDPASCFYAVQSDEIFVPVGPLQFREKDHKIDSRYQFNALMENGRTGIIVFNNLYWFHYYLRKL